MAGGLEARHLLRFKGFLHPTVNAQRIMLMILPFPLFPQTLSKALEHYSDPKFLS